MLVIFFSVYACMWAHYSHNHIYTCTCHNAYMYLSTAPGVQWLVDHGTAYEGDINAEESFSLIHLHCYPEIALAVQGIYLTFSPHVV